MRNQFVMIGALLAVIASLGCAVTVDHMNGRVLTRDVRDAERRANDQIANAKLLLQAGVAPTQVEETLRSNGVDAAQAHHVVEIARAMCQCGKEQ